MNEIKLDAASSLPNFEALSSYYRKFPFVAIIWFFLKLPEMSNIVF